jgi:hypothetical protein
MVDNDVCKGEHVEVLENIKAVSFELRNNLKLLLQFYMAYAKLSEQIYYKQEDWMDELNKLD